MENTPIQFAEGMGFRARHEKAPETVRGSIYFKWNDFKKFCEENVDNKGFVNVKMMKSMKTQGIYFILDTYKPKTDPEATKEYNETKYKNIDDTVSGTMPITHRHPDAGVQSANEKTAEELFSRPLSEEEEYNLSTIPF